MKKRSTLAAIGIALLSITPGLSDLADLTWQRVESTVIFSHSLHVTENDLDCLTCHEEVEASKITSDRLLPTMDVCADCHDVEDEQECSLCHRDMERLEESPHPDRPVLFSHADHLESGIDCSRCHAGILGTVESETAALPSMATCLVCHDGLTAEDNCKSCHGDEVTLVDIHPNDWRHTHGDVTAQGDRSCAGCHRDRSTCLDCHRGDNLTGWTHDLNYAFTHALDAGSKQASCAKCHDTRLFCNDCHESLNRIPLNHSQLSWISDHGREARNDAERCQSCHDSSDPTCARSGCHGDFDGTLGTDQLIHPRDLGRFEREGPWHNNPGSFCFQCHVTTETAGVGFCGYCHGS